ncbi:MAG: hypothetical protein AAF750_15550 [Planctomycetota bacterium]
MSRGHFLATPEQWRSLFAAAEKIHSLRGEGILVDHTARSVALALPENNDNTANTPQVARTFRVRSVQRNLIVAWEHDPEAGQLVQEDVIIAKPAALREDSYADEDETDPIDSTVRRYSYSGTQQRTVTNDPNGSAETENQIITPRYTPAAGGYDGSWIDAIPAYIGVFDDSGTLQISNWLALGDRIYTREAE